jgi:subtilisin-like proprotein convertase family protein
MFGKYFFCRIVAVFQILIFLFLFAPALSAKNVIPQTVYSNAAPITINTTTSLTAPTTATTYPSDITVSGLSGTTTKVEVTLSGVTHQQLRDMDLLLVSPTGAKFIFLSDVGGSGISVNDLVLTFSDTGAANLPFFAPLTSGTYLPTSGDSLPDAFPAPAPVSPYNQPPSANFASVFNGANPNGTWSLYAVDDTLINAGDINSGWSLSITTSGSPATVFSNPAYIGLYDVEATATPYGSTINVSGASGVISNLKVTLNGFSHQSPFDADILLVSPNGRSLVIMSDVGSNVPVTNINLTFDDAAPTQINSVPIVSGTYKVSDIFENEDFFPSPAPLRPYFQGGSPLSNFNGFNPNGDWKLYVVDDRSGGSGSISGGWSLDITTVPATPLPAASCATPSFSPANYSAGVNPTNLAVADFNNDSKPDLAVTNQVSNDVSILLGNGDGTFASQNLVSVGSSPYSIVAGKFNADNNFDLAIVNSGSNNVSILLGNGNGTFSAPTNFTVGASPISIAVGDFNNDSKQDLAVANFGSFFFGAVSILIGNGSGGFTAGNTVRTRTQPSYIAVSNFNGDANQDLIVANFGADSVSTFFGNGNGTFNLSQNVPSNGAGPVAIEIGNFNSSFGSGKIAIANYNADSVTICNVSGAGLLTCNASSSVGANPISITSADFVGNGANSLAVALSGSNTINLSTIFAPFSLLLHVGQNPSAIDSADFNGDGKADLVSVNSGSNDISVLINSCLAGKGNIFDYNGDRKTDYSVFRPVNAGWFVQSLNQSGVATYFGHPTDKVVPADYDGDRKTDFAYYRPETGLWQIVGNTSTPIYFLQFGFVGDIPVPADYDADGKADIAVFRPSNGTWYIRRSSDNLLLISQFGMNGDKPVQGDFDGDDKADLAIYRPSTGVWYIYRSSDGQTTIRQFGISEDKTVAGDYDGDGKIDIAVWRPSTGVWYILRSSDGDFRAVSWGVGTDFPVIGDYDADGRYDYAVWRPSTGVWFIYRSSDNGTTAFQWGINGDFPIPSAFVR